MPAKGQRDYADYLGAAIRNCMYAVKSMNDIGGNIADLQRSSKAANYQLYSSMQKATEALYMKLYDLLSKNASNTHSGPDELICELDIQYKKALEDFYKGADVMTLRDTDITTAINFNREVYSSNKAMAQAVFYFLNAMQAADLLAADPAEEVSQAISAAAFSQPS